MEAPEVAEARLTITAPFCAAEVVMTGAWVGVVVWPPLPPLPPVLALPPPPHPHNKAPDKTIAASIATPVLIASLHLSGVGEWPIRRKYESTSGMPASIANGWDWQECALSRGPTRGSLAERPFAALRGSK